MCVKSDATRREERPARAETAHRDWCCTARTRTHNKQQGALQIGACRSQPTSTLQGAQTSDHRRRRPLVRSVFARSLATVTSLPIIAKDSAFLATETPVPTAMVSRSDNVRLIGSHWSERRVSISFAAASSSACEVADSLHECSALQRECSASWQQMD